MGKLDTMLNTLRSLGQPAPSTPVEGVVDRCGIALSGNASDLNSAVIKLVGQPVCYPVSRSARWGRWDHGDLQVSLLKPGDRVSFQVNAQGEIVPGSLENLDLGPVQLHQGVMDQDPTQ